MRLECLRTDSLITKAVAGRASEAELLRLDAHLETCSACREKQAGFETLRNLQEREAPRLSDAARERVRRKLFATTPPGAGAPAHHRRWAPWAVAATAAGVAAVGLIVAAPWKSRTVPPGAAPQEAAVTVGTRGAGEATVLEPGPAGKVVLDEAVVEIEPGTEALWRPSARTVELRAGAVIVDVAPGRGPGFRVRTPAFTVQVAGTRFRVDLGGVATERGLVWVLGLDDRRLAEVPAGSQWRAAATASQPVATAAVPPPAQAPRANGTRAPVERPTRPAAELLAEARHALSKGRVDHARALVRPLLTERGGVAVEAHSVLAESYLVAHQHGEAIRRYRIVARDFAGTPQAESALYAIAQLESERGDRDAAAQALQRYLTRYPAGRYAAEARQRLARLSAPGR
ncbi:MAG: FecR domain-containing protein [Deltaproteobacteria bacterium]|nr:FecR domain-containing protein [Deltaproteobacteria bacterium]